MLLNFSNSETVFVLEVLDDGRTVIKDLRRKGALPDARDITHTPISEIQVAGGNPAEHHFAKHSGTSESHTLRYVTNIINDTENSKNIRILQKNDRLEVLSTFCLYDGFSVLRCQTEVRNIGDTPVGLEYVSSFSYTGLDGGVTPTDRQTEILIPHNAWQKEADFHSYTPSELGYCRRVGMSGKRIAVANSGTFSAKEYLPMGAVINKELHNTFLFQIENNGSWAWEISDKDSALYLRLSGPTEAENHWYKELLPGESFVSVPVAVALGRDFNDALASLSRYRMTRIPDFSPDETLPVIFNDYMNCLGADPTEEKMLPVIEAAAKSGAEYYVMDAGWYADGGWWDTVGEWLPSEKRFPHGIKAVFDAVKAKNMIPGIWLEIEVMGIHCPLAAALPDDWFFVRHGRRVIDNGRYLLDFRNPDVRKYATSVIDRVVTEYGVGYIKIDYNVDGGIGTEIGADSFGDGLLGHCRAYTAWIAEIRRKYPRLILENCSSGGMRMDYAMLSVYDLQSLTDQGDVHYNADIAAAAPIAVLPRQAAVWAYPKENDDGVRVALNMINAMLNRIHLSGAVTALSDAAQKLVRDGVSVYKTLRESIKTAYPRYPLGIPRYGDGFIAYESVSDTARYLAVWRKDTEKESVEIPLSGKAEILYPTGMDYADVMNISGGVKVILKEKYSAVLLKITD